ncbi:hypothetical protein GE061_019652 [Apolygus lucorum]|uniref:Uncharacterized protein n=1 Tax=Apolygus lucorum TaxID=248454 RepID=A0A8S9XA77_APOLU|nr:hypothetical protein GE061_019652 [Apolygus lucorum]
MIAQIIFLLITAWQINFSLQSEVCHPEGDQLSTLVNLPRPFPLGGRGGFGGFPSPSRCIDVPTRPVAAEVNLGSIGPAAVDIGAHNLNLKRAPVGLRPAQCYYGPSFLNAESSLIGLSPTIGFGAGSINLRPSVSNVAPICSGAVLDATRPFLSSVSSDLVASGAGLQIPATPLPQSSQHCIKNVLVPVPVQVVEECIRNIPVIRRTIRHRIETITRRVPIVEKTLTQQHENVIRHVPVTRKFIRNVVEMQVHHVPVVKSRCRQVVEPFTLHVPITERYKRPVEESITKMIPYTETRMRPVVMQRTRLVPIIERRCRPVVETCIQHIPIRSERNVMKKQSYQSVMGPCCPYVLRYDRPELSKVPDVSGSPLQEKNIDNEDDDSSPQCKNVEDKGAASNSGFAFSPKNQMNVFQYSDAMPSNPVGSEQKVPSDDSGQKTPPDDCKQEVSSGDSRQEDPSDDSTKTNPADDARNQNPDNEEEESYCQGQYIEQEKECDWSPNPVDSVQEVSSDDSTQGVSLENSGQEDPSDDSRQENPVDDSGQEDPSDDRSNQQSIPDDEGCDSSSQGGITEQDQEMGPN